MNRLLTKIFLAVLILSGCDTENNFPSPYQNRFVKFYGGDGNHEGVDFIVMDDGSIILVGNQILSGATLGEQIYVVKVNGTGEVLWEKTLGSAGDDVAKDIELTPEGNIIIVGESYKSLTERDVYVKIISSAGDELDSVRVSGVFKTESGDEADEEVKSVSIIQDGFIVAGSTTAVKTLKSSKPNDTRDAIHLRLTKSLDLVDPSTGLWSNTTGLDDSEDVLVKMIQVSATEYYGFGYTNTIRNNSRDYKYWVFSLGATGVPVNNGVELLDRIGSINNDEILSNVIESPPQAAEGFVLNGLSRSNSGATSSFVVKLQKKLFMPGEDNVLEEQSPTQLGNDVNGATRMTSSVQGGFLLLSNNNKNPNEAFNVSLAKLSNTCSLLWEASPFGGTGNDYASAVAELPDGRIVISGTMTLGGATPQTKMFLIKLNSEGQLVE